MAGVGPMGTGRGPASEAVGMQRAPGIGTLLDGPPVTAHAIVDAVVADGLKGGLSCGIFLNVTVERPSVWRDALRAWSCMIHEHVFPSCAP